MKKYLLLLVVAVSISGLFSCEKDKDSNDTTISEKKEVTAFLNARSKISLAQKTLKHFDIPANIVFSSLNQENPGSLKKSYNDFYLDYWKTKGIVSYKKIGTKHEYTVDYGKNATNEYGYKLTGKFVISLKKDGDNVIEKRLWTLTIDGSEVKGSVTRNISRVNGKLKYQVNSKDFTVKYDRNITLKENATFVETLTKNNNEIISGNYTINSSNGESFRQNVAKKIVYDFTWSKGMLIPVSGVEEVTYKIGNKTSTVTLDYGNGEKDTIVTITRTNGVKETLKF